MTNTAVMARGPPFVYAGQNRGTADGHDAVVEIFRQGIAKILFDTGHLHRREKFTVGQLRQSLGLAPASREFFSIIITPSKIPVTNPPTHGDPFPPLCFAVHV